MVSTSSIDQEAHRSVLRYAVMEKRNDLVDLALRHLHNPSDQPVDLSMVDDAVLREYKQLVQGRTETSGPVLNGSNHDSSPVSSIRSGDSASSKASQASYDPRDIFDQVINSMIERLSLLIPAIKGTRLNRLIGKDRSRRTSLVADLRNFRDDKLASHFGISDSPRRVNLGSNGFSREYLRRRDVCYTEILDIQAQLFGISEDENIRKNEALQDDQVAKIRGKLELWSARLTVMAEQMRNAPFLDYNTSPVARTPDAMEVDDA